MHAGIYASNTRSIPRVCRLLSTRASSSVQRVDWNCSLPPRIPGFRNSRIYPLSILQASLRTNVDQVRRWYSSKDSGPITDPSRPDLFYHVLSPPTPLSSSIPAFGLSFLSTQPSSGESSAIIGWLPAAAEGRGQEAGLSDFKENRK